MKFYYESYLPEQRDEVYLKNYRKFIENKLRRTLISKKTEKHHIVPCCFLPSEFSNNEKDKENLVILTYEEHYIAHFLLYKSFKSKKMVSAFWMMSNRQTCLSVKLSAKEYSRFREDYSKINSKKSIEINKRNWSSEEYRIKMSERFKEGWKKRRERIASGELPNRKRSKSSKKPSNFGKVWITDGNKNRYISKEEIELYQSKGYRLGLTRSWKENGKEDFIKRRKRERWVNDGIKNYHIDQDLVEEWIEKGYKLGFLKAIKPENKDKYSERRRNMTTINNGIRDFVVDNSRLHEYLEKGYIIGSVRRGRPRKKDKN